MPCKKMAQGGRTDPLGSWVGAYQLILLSWKTDQKTRLSSLIGSSFQLNKEAYGELFTSPKAPCLFFLPVDRQTQALPHTTIYFQHTAQLLGVSFFHLLNEINAYLNNPRQYIYIFMYMYTCIYTQTHRYTKYLQDIVEYIYKHRLCIYINGELVLNSVTVMC